jgi:hypothetical protein
VLFIGVTSSSDWKKLLRWENFKKQLRVPLLWLDEICSVVAITVWIRGNRSELVEQLHCWAASLLCVVWGWRICEGFELDWVCMTLLVWCYGLRMNLEHLKFMGVLHLFLRKNERRRVLIYLVWPQLLICVSVQFCASNHWGINSDTVDYI